MDGLTGSNSITVFTGLALTVGDGVRTAFGGRKNTERANLHLSVSSLKGVGLEECSRNVFSLKRTMHSGRR